MIVALIVFVSMLFMDIFEADAAEAKKRAKAAATEATSARLWAAKAAEYEHRLAKHFGIETSDEL
jgi:hypothetical protein